MLDKEKIILIVDDTMMMREGLRRVLASMGYENTMQAEHGKQALNIIESGEHDIGAVFLDIVMPVMDGKEALKKIREINKNLPVIMVTSRADKDSIVECSKLGMSSYVLKPINVVEGPGVLEAIFTRL
ncbi:MAG: response regulator [Gammaproteobacteria bacterium]|nr:response regulator [Gammaproteobacteria bacterium]